MRQMWKWLMISLLFVFLFHYSVVMAENRGTWGDLIWVLDNDGTLTITGNGDMNGLYDSTSAWYPYKQSIKHVVIGEGVTSVGAYAFYECSNIQSIWLSNSVRSIGGDAFRECDNLTSVFIPSNVKKYILMLSFSVKN